jgi:transposase-like protein
MPAPRAPVVRLTAELRCQLQTLTRASSTPQALAFRSRLILRSAEDDRPTNGTIATELGCSRNTVALWRTRFSRHGLAGLQDAPRTGRPPVFSPRRTTRGHQPGERADRRA